MSAGLMMYLGGGFGRVRSYCCMQVTNFANHRRTRRSLKVRSSDHLLFPLLAHESLAQEVEGEESIVRVHPRHLVP